MPGDGQRLMLTVLFAVWVVAFAYAFVAYANGGTEKVSQFLGWQGVAGLCAIAVFGVSRSWPKGSAVRQLALAPVGFAVLVVVAMVVVRIWSTA